MEVEREMSHMCPVKVANNCCCILRIRYLWDIFCRGLSHYYISDNYQNVTYERRKLCFHQIVSIPSPRFRKSGKQVRAKQVHPIVSVLESPDGNDMGVTDLKRRPSLFLRICIYKHFSIVRPCFHPYCASSICVAENALNTLPRLICVPQPIFCSAD